MPQVRVDPLTGLKTIIAGERAERPGGGFDVPPRRRRSTRRTDPFADGHEDQTPPELYACADGGTDTPGWTCASSRTCSPRSSPTPRTPEREAHPDLFTAQPAAGAHEVIVNAPDAGDLARRPVRGAGRSSPSRRGASGCAPTLTPPAGT